MGDARCFAILLGGCVGMFVDDDDDKSVTLSGALAVRS